MTLPLSTPGEAFHYCPDILSRALRAKLPGIVWIRTGGEPGHPTTKQLFSFGDSPTISLAADSGLVGLDQLLASLPSDDAPYTGYAIALAYEAGALCDDAIARDTRVASNELIRLRRLDACYVADDATQTGFLYFSSGCSKARRQEFRTTLENLALQRPAAHLILPPPLARHSLANAGEFDAEEYARVVTNLKEHISAGDFYECNFTQRFRVSSQASAAHIGLALYSNAPARHACYMDLGDQQIVCNSPEQFLRIDHRKISTSPIKGSIPRGTIGHHDDTAKLSLQCSAKDHAEHTMVLDMARNDLGRICTPGSVKVSIPFALETHPALHHLVSTVTGELTEHSRRISSIMRATYPAASITGTPKIAAIRKIAEVERSARGLYTGAVGVISANSADLKVAIRSIVCTTTGMNTKCEFGAGGAVVADSDPAAEYQECLAKAQPLYDAIQNAPSIKQL